MSIITKSLEDRVTGRNYEDRFLHPKVEENVTVFDHNMPELLVHRIEFLCFAQYTCKAEDSVYARQHAIRQIHEELYADVRETASRIRAALLNREWLDAMDKLDALYQLINGEEG